jgi:DNA-binding transcriptional regulator YdaS (Cro superfamily)
MTDAQLIDMLGKPAKVAKLCGVTVQAVCQWRNNNQIPAAPLMLIAATIEKESVGLVTRKDLFPDNYGLIWPELLEKDKNGQPA